MIKTISSLEHDHMLSKCLAFCLTVQNDLSNSANILSVIILNKAEMAIVINGFISILT